MSKCRGLRIWYEIDFKSVADEGKVIYIDPYAGDFYELPADLILVIYSHFDRNQTDKVEKRNEGCWIITYKEAVQKGEYQILAVQLDADSMYLYVEGD